jgi:Tol biopolymer transport system component
MGRRNVDDDKQKNEFIIIDEDLPKRKRKPKYDSSEAWRALIVLIVGIILGAGGLLFAASYLWEPFPNLAIPNVLLPTSTTPPLPRPTMPPIPATWTPSFPTTPEPTRDPAAWELLFVAESSIYRVNSQDSAPTVFLEWAADPQFSPDGTHLAYTHYVESQPYLYLAQSDGSDAQEVNEGESIAYNSYFWSPDGTTLAYSNAWRMENNLTTNDAALRIFDVEAGTNRTLITDNMDPFPYYQWSPDSQRIAFLGADYLLYVVDVQSGAVERMSTTTVFPALFQWSPDGTQLAYVNVDQSTIYITPTQQTNPSTNSTYQPAGRVSAITWSPDGTQFAFVFGTMPPILQVMNPDDVTASPLIIPLPGHSEVRGSTVWIDNNRLMLVLGLCGSMVQTGEISSGSLYSVDLDRQRAEKMIDVGDYACGGSNAGHTYWSVSPDGTQLAHTISNFPEMGGIHLTNLDTGDTVSLMSDIAPFAPVWRP